VSPGALPSLPSPNNFPPACTRSEIRLLFSITSLPSIEDTTPAARERPEDIPARKVSLFCSSVFSIATTGDVVTILSSSSAIFARLDFAFSTCLSAAVGVRGSPLSESRETCLMRVFRLIPKASAVA